MKTEEATIAPHFGFHILVVEEIFVLYDCILPNEKKPEDREISLQRLIDGLSAAGKSAVLFVFRPKENNIESDIQADKGIVEKVYWNNRWYKGNGYTVKELTDRFINWAETLIPER